MAREAVRRFTKRFVAKNTSRLPQSREEISMIPLGRQPATTAEQICSKTFGCNALENSEERIATGTTFGCGKRNAHIISNDNVHSTTIVFIS